MNLTIGNTFPRALKHFGARHVMAAGTLGIALTVALAGALSLEGGSSGGSAATGPARPVYTAPVDTITYYIVGSQAEAQALESARALAEAEAQSGVAPLQRIAAPVVLETLEQEAQFRAEVVYPRVQSGQSLTIVDLRGK